MYVRALVLTSLLLTTMAEQAHAQLGESDRAALIQALDKLSAGWDGNAAAQANGYLSRVDVTAEEWEAFFRDYLESRPVTLDLANYLAYPTFHWYGVSVSTKLQLATSVALQSKLDEVLTENGGYLGTTLSVDSLRQTVVGIHQHMNRLFNLAVSDEAWTAAYDYYQNHLEEHDPILRKTYTIDVVQHPHLGAVRAQILMNLRDVLWARPELKAEVATLIGLDEPALASYREIWDERDVLVIDNNTADGPQLRVIYDMLGLIPAELHDLGTIRMRDFLGSGAQGFAFRQRHGVNIFTNRVGSQQENGFPHDIEPLPADQYTIVVAHEINHVVDAYYIGGNTTRKNRRDQLIREAGDFQYHYLRSHVGDGFFTRAPQEFFASISNQYFVSSRHTLELGVSRFRRGFRHPINQVLFFADIYSLGTDSTYFYSIDRDGYIERETIRLRRDDQGRIIELTFPEGGGYSFELREDGGVKAIEATPTAIDGLGQELPQRLILEQNYPNPFSVATTIQYELPTAAEVHLDVMDLLGRRVETIVAGEWQGAGRHSVEFDATDLPSGNYFYRLNAGDASVVRPMKFIK